jgi:hypothetical protein
MPALAKRSRVGAGALGGIAVGQIFHNAYPLQRVTPGRTPSVKSQPIPADFPPDTFASACKPKSTFAFTLWVKPGKPKTLSTCPFDQPQWTSSNFSTAVPRMIKSFANP